MAVWSWRYGDSTLVRGDGDNNDGKNGYVRNVQSDLNTFGTRYDCGTVDGIFGQKTERAVRDFQDDREWLDTDGKVGMNTKSALYQEVHGPA